MTQPQADSGLCSTCAHAQSCSITGRKGSGVFECSEYEPAEATALAETAPATSADCVREDRLLGLCLDCVHRERCAFPRPEGGIWHCEEYAAE